MLLKALRRASPAGELDLEFGCSGKALVRFPGSLSSQANDVVFCADGKILVVAKVDFIKGACFGLARLHSDGSMDTSFGESGSLAGGFETEGESTGISLCPLPDGRILLFGLHYLDERRTLPAVARFFADGRLDPQFGNQGIQVLRLPGNLSEGPRDGWLPPGLPGVESCSGSLQPDGKILLSLNHNYACADHVGLLVRLEPDGALDHSFNGHGFVVVRRQRVNTWLSCVQVQPDGKILAGGSIDFPSSGLIVRYLADGRLDSAFGDEGYLSVRFAGASSMVTQLARGAQDQVLCVGNRFDPLGGALQGFTANGYVTGRFNKGEAVLLEIDAPASQWAAIAVQADGTILAAGSTVGGFDSDLVLARYLPNGRLDRDFAAGQGWARTRLGKSLDTATAIALQSDRRILVAGHSLLGTFRAVVMRYLG
ncbi:hypothetical protein AWM79_14785 [Pseudomonas agarici]|uniref:Delta-60 repeat domain-containing protein n=1 Tax=Pseudomonas agarici TaxID=46677 RepID=A0A0X1T362_PSEAA|nr:hypothetical protein [Pseudomonas agarici]AMB86500.1 hypothetical protein AWM79_14785 [Pseudomonas agarici]NWB93693.1 hypothetical protein [Pseudomonas agarici]NWC11085.1 hypothetical protein [Pseudomonas agarici]SEL59037.1 delta-60 repeat domain-containing protein [Pseudomonas agarici]